MAADPLPGALYADVDIVVVMDSAERHYDFLFQYFYIIGAYQNLIALIENFVKHASPL